MITQLPPNLLPIAPNVIFRPPTITITQPQTSGRYTVNQQQMWSTYNPNLAPRKRRCALCKEAGRDGSDCPGKSNRTLCKYKCKFYILLCIIMSKMTWRFFRACLSHTKSHSLFLYLYLIDLFACKLNNIPVHIKKDYAYPGVELSGFWSEKYH